MVEDCRSRLPLIQGDELTGYSAQRVGFFDIGQVWSGIGQNTGKQVGFGSGRSVEIYDRAFPGIFFTLRYFRIFRVFLGMSGISGFTSDNLL